MLGGDGEGRCWGSGQPGEGGDSVGTKGRQGPRETMAGQIGSSCSGGGPVREHSSHQSGVIFILYSFALLCLIFFLLR